jgi:hypothetical protein
MRKAYKILVRQPERKRPFVRPTCINFLFTSCLLNYSVSSSHYIVSNGRIINELERMWKEAVTVYFTVLSQQMPGGTVRHHEKSVRIADLLEKI